VWRNETASHSQSPTCIAHPDACGVCSCEEADQGILEGKTEVDQVMIAVRPTSWLWP
jgi:hypothetical protein